MSIYPKPNTLRVVVFGATGTVGAGVLLECLESPAVTQVLCVVRRSTGRSHPKLREIVHENFHDFSSLAPEFCLLDACFWCVGIPSRGLSESRYTEVTHDYTLAAARELRQRSPALCFILVSGVGADETEQSRSMWARVKGRTENAILSLGFRSAIVLRPGMISPQRGLRHNVRLYSVVTTLLRPFRSLLRARGLATSTVEIGRAMIAAALGQHVGGSPKLRLDSHDINQLAKLAPQSGQFQGVAFLPERGESTQTSAETRAR